jgi:hypothetical protein
MDREQILYLLDKFLNDIIEEKSIEKRRYLADMIKRTAVQLK